MEYPEHGPGKTVGELYHVLEPGGTGHMFGFKRNSDKLSDTIVPLGKSAPVMFSGSDLLIEQEQFRQSRSHRVPRTNSSISTWAHRADAYLFVEETLNVNVGQPRDERTVQCTVKFFPAEREEYAAHCYLFPARTFSPRTTAVNKTQLLFSPPSPSKNSTQQSIGPGLSSKTSIPLEVGLS